MAGKSPNIKHKNPAISNNPPPADELDEKVIYLFKKLVYTCVIAIVAMALISTLITEIKIYVPDAPVDQYKNYITYIGGAAIGAIFLLSKTQI